MEILQTKEVNIVQPVWLELLRLCVKCVCLCVFLEKIERGKGREILYASNVVL